MGITTATPHNRFLDAGALIANLRSGLSEVLVDILSINTGSMNIRSRYCDSDIPD